MIEGQDDYLMVGNNRAGQSQGPAIDQFTEELKEQQRKETF